MLFFTLLYSVNSMIDIITQDYIKYNYKFDTDNVIDINYKTKVNFSLLLYNVNYNTIVSLINNNETFQSVILYNKYNNNITTRLQFPYIQEYEKHNYLNFTINITSFSEGTYTYTYTSTIFVEMNYDVYDFYEINGNVNNNVNNISRSVLIVLILFAVVCLLSLLILCFVKSLR